MTKSSTSNDQRSNVKNPNNPAYVADRANRVQLGHPDAPPPAEITTQADGTTATKERK